MDAGASGFPICGPVRIPCPVRAGQTADTTHPSSGHACDACRTRGQPGGPRTGRSCQTGKRRGPSPVTPSNEEAQPVIAQPELPGFGPDPERPPKSLLRQQIEEVTDHGVMAGYGCRVGFGARSVE